MRLRRSPKGRALTTSRPFMKRFVLLLMMFVGTASAHELTIAALPISGAAAGSVSITLRSPSREPLQRSVNLGQTVVVDVPNGTWTVEVTSDRWWSARRTLFVNAPLRAD